MYALLFTKQFEKSFSKIKDRTDKNQIWKKILQLEKRAPIGKKLKDQPCWSIHINRYRIIYRLEGTTITIIDLLSRKYDYREL